MTAVSPGMAQSPIRHVSRKIVVLIALIVVLCTTVVRLVHAADLSSAYSWQPVHLGAGGWVVGMAVLPSNPSVRFARTDIGNVYRWSATTNSWLPMKVRFNNPSPAYTGMPSADAAEPAYNGGVGIAVDPSNSSFVYEAHPSPRDTNEGYTSNNINVYYSSDGGQTFSAGNLNVPGDANDNNWRFEGERLAVDPNQGQVIYFGSPPTSNTNNNPTGVAGSGLWRSTNRGATWSQVTGGPATNANVINILYYSGGGTVTNFGLTNVTNDVVAVVGDGDVFLSKNGGSSWSNISTGQGISGQCGMATIDSHGNIRVPQYNNGSANPVLYTYSIPNSAWSTSTISAIGGYNPIRDVQCDPTDSTGNHLWGICQDGSCFYSTNGGATWSTTGRYGYANTFSWLPQTVANAAAGGYRSTGGVYFDNTGTVWTCEGQEGIMYYKPTYTETGSPLWTISSTGIEELVTQQVVMPKGSGDHLLVAAEDVTGFELDNLDNYTSTQINLQTSFISQGSGIASSPNDPTYDVASTSDVYDYGENDSGYSTNGGKTWTRFGGVLTYQTTNNGQPVTVDVQAGSIAVSSRNSGSIGSSNVSNDNIVNVPLNSFLPEYSTNGGQTWAVSSGFPADPTNSLAVDTSQYQGMFNFSLQQAPLIADPFVQHKFYYKWTHSPASLYASTDGGATWSAIAASGQLPDYTYQQELVANYAVQGDLWFAPGWASLGGTGLYHSTNSGVNWSQVSGITNAVCVALGKGSGNSGDQPYTVYVYGLATGYSNWGVFRSTNGGTSWDQISYYPTGIYDQPTDMTASWDTYGKVVISLHGNSCVYGVPSGSGGTTIPAAPTLSGSAGNTSVSLTWNAPTGATSYQVKYGTTSGSYTTTLASQTGTTANIPGLANGTTYYFVVTASNSAGTSGYSNILPLTPSAGGTPPVITITASSISPSTTVATGTSITYSVTFKNTGGALSNGQLGIRVNNSSGTQVDSYTLTGVNLAANATQTITYPSTASTTAGTYTVYGAAWDSTYATTYVYSQIQTLTVTSTPTAATPTFSPVGGTYTGTQSVTLLDTTSGNTMYYTTNGSQPTTSSSKYTGSISVAASETLEAIAVAPGYNQSATASATYTINAAPPVITITASSISPGTSVTHGTAITYSVTFKNTGGTLTNGQLGIRVNNSSGTQVDAYTLSGVNLASGATKTITYPSTAPTTKGTYTVYGAAWDSTFATTYIYSLIQTLTSK